MQVMRPANRDDARRSMDVNNFDAIQIKLASPHDIKTWSYGEVTKPETINYRTLKPEHGGLFCERIFGPTRDWECYCGKYKRIRHAGTVCDKCGVEVTRSKVRRERMGHIELAAPVTHIWYVKGTPSRLGLLLDISPRNLERVLYFASYLITEVDVEAQQAMIEEINQARDDALAEVEAEFKDKVASLTGTRDVEVKSLTQGSKDVTADIKKKRSNDQRAVTTEKNRLRKQLEKQLGESAEEEITFRGQVIVEKGEAINDDRILALEATANDIKAEIAAAADEQIENANALVGAESDTVSSEITNTLKDYETQLDTQRAQLKSEADGLVKRIGSIVPLQVLVESDYRELVEDAPGVFRAGMGAEAVYEVVSKIDMDELSTTLRQDMQRMTGLKRKKATKRLRVIEALRKSGNRPEWMIFTALPVIPPDLRPMVQLDGGRFATSDLNDLYRRVINRNNRLKRLLELGAPDIIVRNEKRMLQEAVDALIDNGRRGRVVSGSGKHKLKSLSDMLKGKQGRFRQNLLGKRVDYSGRSVIVVGPDLKLDECGLPKRMALELFKPFVMRKLVVHGFAHNIKAAKRLVERVDENVWEVLEEVIKDHVVLLNRAPTLHRLGIQAFKVRLIEGSAIQIHPLVCTAFNADFDGDQMAVHVPLSRAAQNEARSRMLSTANLLDPSDGTPVIAPTLEIVLGCYYMTRAREGVKGEGKTFASANEVLMAYQLDLVDLHAQINVFDPKASSIPLKGDIEQRAKEGMVATTVGRVLFNMELPAELRFWNELMDRKELRKLVYEAYRMFTPEQTAEIADRIKQIGFSYSTRGGLSIGMQDIVIPEEKDAIIAKANEAAALNDQNYRDGFVGQAERLTFVERIWNDARSDLSTAVEGALGSDNSLFMMTNSGAKGNLNQVTQMAGMRGLMLDPSGKVIDLPIRSNFREGLSVLEYFISTHGARKGGADTALRTADSGYLTRRLVDVSQDVIVTMTDCETKNGINVNFEEVLDMFDDEQLQARIEGRVAADPIVTEDGEIICDRNQEITEEVYAEIRAAGIKEIRMRTPMECEAVHGVCSLCYGRNLASGEIVEHGEAVGIIAAQSIGEPGTQLTMRTFHTGGVSHADDITTGLPRVEELFEARQPKGKAVLAENEGTVEVVEEPDGGRVVIVRSHDVTAEKYELGTDFVAAVKDGEKITRGQIVANSASGADPQLSTLDGIAIVDLDNGTIIVRNEEVIEKEYAIAHTTRVRVDSGEKVNPGDQLVDGNLDPHDVLNTRGREAVQRLLVDEVQKVYKSQGVVTNDKHIETIVRQMLRKVSIDDPGDTDYLPGELADRFAFNDVNAEMLAQGGEPATAQEILLGITKASLATDSFLSAASFMETTRVLTEAAINGRVDHLRGLKENVIIGKLIPAGTGFDVKTDLESVLTDSDEAALAMLADGTLLENEPKTIEQIEEMLSRESATAETPTDDAPADSGLSDEVSSDEITAGIFGDEEEPGKDD